MLSGGLRQKLTLASSATDCRCAWSLSRGKNGCWLCCTNGTKSRRFRSFSAENARIAVYYVLPGKAELTYAIWRARSSISRTVGAGRRDRGSLAVHRTGAATDDAQSAEDTALPAVLAPSSSVGHRKRTKTVLMNLLRTVCRSPVRGCGSSARRSWKVPRNFAAGPSMMRIYQITRLTSCTPGSQHRGAEFVALLLGSWSCGASIWCGIFLHQQRLFEGWPAIAPSVFGGTDGRQHALAMYVLLGQLCVSF